jgi:1,4-alpha-glucan branching enzyme
VIEAPANSPPVLPTPRGPARATLLLVHPRRLFLYWIRDPILDQAIRSAAGPAQISVEASIAGEAYKELDRHDFDFRAPGWYLSLAQSDCRVRVRLGVLEGKSFRSMLLSNEVRVPREKPGEALESWEDFGELRQSRSRRQSGSSPAGNVPWTAGAHKMEASSRRTEAQGPTRSALGYLAMVLHAHLPFVRHPEREYFLEEHWLFEGITETYLPILEVLEQLSRDQIRARLTMSLTPTLMMMLRDRVLMEKYARHLDRMCELARRELVRTRYDAEFASTAGFYQDRLLRFRSLFNKEYGKDLVSQFARLEAEGVLEIIGCAATHGMLPALGVNPEAVRAQVLLGVSEHRRQIGRDPRGFWIPECAYFEGLGEILAEAGIEYFFVDAHAFRAASRRPRLDLHAPILCPSGVAAFSRDQETTVQVWSSKEGYPGDPEYRDFYRDIGFDLPWKTVGEFLDPAGTRSMTGFKYHRITGSTDQKEPYRRAAALRRVAEHSRDFLDNRRRQMEYLASGAYRPPLITSMYDAELFGHWWFEGPEWLNAVLRGLGERGLRAVSPGDYLEEFPVSQVSEPSTSSWGEGGYFEVWINPKNDWIYPPLHDAARRMIDLVTRFGTAGGLAARALAQAGRELLLAQSSDWPFILKNETAVGYAKERIHQHLARFHRLEEFLESGRVDEAELGKMEAQDNLFPDIDVGLWRSA